MAIPGPYEIMTTPGLLEQCRAKPLLPGWRLPWGRGEIYAFISPLGESELFDLRATVNLVSRMGRFTATARFRLAADSPPGAGEVGGVALTLNDDVWAAVAYSPPFVLTAEAAEMSVPLDVLITGASTYDSPV